MSKDEQPLVIEIPYEGTLAKDLLKVIVNLLILTGSVEIRQLGSSLRVVGSVSSALKTVSNLVHKVMDFKKKQKVRWPPLLNNDRETLKKNSKIVSSKVDRMETYGDLIEEYINILPELAEIREVKFSEGNIALLQLFKVEFYEASALTYNKPYKYKIELKTNDYMLSLLLAGLGIAYMGFIEILIPSILGDVCAAKTYLAINLSSLKLGKIASDPVIPYVFYNHVIIHKLATEAHRILPELTEFTESSRLCPETAMFVVHRLSLMGGTYVETSREEIRITREILDFISKIDKNNCLNGFIELIHMASKAQDANALNTLIFLYEALHKACDPAFVSYYLARYLADLNYELNHTPIKEKCFELILYALMG